MTVVATKDSRKVVSNSGFVNPIAFDQYVESSTHIKVYADTTLLSVGTHYSISGLGDLAGIQVTISATGLALAPTNWVVLHDPLIDQDSDLSVGGTFGTAYETGLDKLTRRMQAMRESLGRAVKVAVDFNPAAVVPTLPVAAAGLLIGWNGAATALENKTLASIGLLETLPAVANSVIFRNAANTAYEAKLIGTSGDAIPLLNGVNTWSGSSTFTGATTTLTGSAIATTYTTEPAPVIDTYFGSTWRSVHKFHSENTALVNEALSHFTVSIVREWIGNEANTGTGGGTHGDGALFLEAKHPSYLTNDNYGQTLTAYLNVAAGRRDNHSCLQIGAAKVFDGTYDGSVSSAEGRTYMLDDTGVTTKRGAWLIGWAMSDVGTNFSPLNMSIFTAECDLGDLHCAYAAVEDTVNGEGFEHILAGSLSRNNLNIFVDITGSAHADGPGLIRGGAHATTPEALPTFSWWNDTDSGVTRTAANTVAVVTAGVARLTISSVANFAVNIQRNGVQVLGAQLAAVADATDAATAISQLNTLLARLRAGTGHGLIAA